MQILVADDSLVMRRLLCACLQKWDYDVVAVEDGAQAWQRFQEGQFPLIITDWLMPAMDGLELIRRIRACELDHYVYIILLTAKSEKEDLVVAMEAGADDFLAKPFDTGELRVRIREGERIITLQRTLAEQNRQLRETQAALIQSETLAGLGQLAAGMAHEINTPLAYVTNNLAVLKREVGSLLELLTAYRSEQNTPVPVGTKPAADASRPEEDGELAWIEENLPRLFDSSLDGLGRMRDVVNNLRQFARLDEAELDDVDLNVAVRSTVEIMRRQSDEKQLSLRLRLGELPRILCHPAKMNQLVHHLLLNAIQASEPGGTIELRTAADHEQAVLEVEDHGTGIDPAHLPRIFDPFFTTRPVGSGKGLGLAVCYGIVRDHGGTIDVTTRLGEGSTFRVSLPFHPPSTKEAPS
ncbi:MAG: hybrid sensor histidine kinase/response regulator [Rhodopirellula sp.]|nr:hybrid sensor histidine kinase/response regulator [Rhodopirellula sp.]